MSSDAVFCRKTRPVHSPGSRALRLGFLTPHNPYDATTFSGTTRFAMQALSACPDVELRVLGGHAPLRRFDRIARKLGRAPTPARPPARADLAGLDAVVGLVATSLLDGLSDLCDLPFVNVTDATPEYLAEAYGWDIPQTVRAAEARVAWHAHRVIYSSEEMAARAPVDLGLGAEMRTAVLPFGINFDALPDTPPQKETTGPLELLFVGNDWHRKGGDRALAILEGLTARGIDTRLTLVGNIPDCVKPRPGLRIAGYLRKAQPRDAARLRALYARAHLLILPTRGDCTPMVMAEAWAHATPVLATDTGGIASRMTESGAGALLPPEAGDADWVARIESLTDGSVLADMGRRGFLHARDHLGWDTWARGIVSCFTQEIPASAALVA